MKRNTVLILLILQLLFNNVVAQVSNRNFIFSWNVVTPNIKDANQLDKYSLDETQKSISYCDDLGRVEQTLKLNYTASGKDLIFPIVLNEVGLDEINYQPYSDEGKAGSFRNEEDVYNGNRAFYYNNFQDTYGYKPILYEKSTLQRIKKQGAQGKDWQLDSHYLQFEYIFNSDVIEDLKVNNWIINEDKCFISGVYPKEKLLVTKIIDNSNTKTIFKFTDFEGNLILTREIDNYGGFFDTYYIYDMLQNLRYVICPEGIKNNVTSFNNGDDFSAKYVYSYKYDSRRRIIERKIPGKSTEYYVYNKNNKLILYSNDNLFYGYYRSWKFIKYDALDREIIKGIINYYYTNFDRDKLQTLADQCLYSFEILNSDIPTYPAINDNYYTNRSFPDLTGIFSIDEILYYDTYYVFVNNQQKSIINDPTMAFEVGSSSLNLGSHNQYVHGLQTIAFTKFNTSLLPSVNYYDSHNRIMQSRIRNHLNGIEIFNYSFARLDDKYSNVEHLHKTLINGATFEQKELYTYTYDNSGRLSERSYRCGLSPVQKVQYTYNECDYPIKIGIFESNILVQTITYEYNIRGWLTKINDPNTVNSNGSLFGSQIFYNQESPITNQKLYNGNISSELWSCIKPSGIIDSYIEGTKGYEYKYDLLNRLTSASFHEKNTGTWNNTKYFDMDIKYDGNGNIITLKRNGKFNNSSFCIDDLNYVYDGNQVIAVDDAVLSQLVGSFNDNGHYYIPGNNEYTYDKNGNLKTDVHKGISNMSYDKNNLVTVINLPGSCRIEYLYDAKRVKKRELIFRNGLLESTIDYSHNFVYKNGVPIYNNFDDGVIPYINSTVSNAKYFLKDHLGNIRVTYQIVNGLAKVIKTDSYYPFGMDIKDLCKTNNETKDIPKKKYISKDFNQEFGIDYYDFGARAYDPILCRWNSIDPFGEEYYNVSLYQYCNNNPMKFIDPDGRYFLSDNEAEYDEMLQYFSRWQAKEFDIIKNMKVSDLSSKKMKDALMKFNALARVTTTLEKMYNNPNIQYRILYGEYKPETVYNNINNSVDIRINKNQAFAGALEAHEIIHIDQFENGDLAFTNSDKGYAAMDIWDEIDAYSVQFILNPESVQYNNPSQYINKVTSISPEWVRGIIEDGDYLYRKHTNLNLTIECSTDDYRRAYPHYIPIDLPNSLIKDSPLFITNH
ncbi:MAG TPA: DUF6443 domain-containing protein [Lentimicrobium sp.]|nr:DUF6443 domain-containing protein [Lentimicrobium sp.]